MAPWIIQVTSPSIKNINNLSYTDDTTIMAESEEELKCLLIKVKEKSEKVGETMETMTDFIFLGSKITADCDMK